MARETVKIDSEILSANVWLTSDKLFKAPDSDPVYYHDELKFLKTKTHEQLQNIYAIKLIFGGGVVIA